MIKFAMYAVIIILSAVIITFLLTYPLFNEKMNKVKNDIKEQSEIIETKYGKMEYAVRGKGEAVLLIHGAGGGFDQGLWLGEISLKDEYLFIAPSKFGYINSDIPDQYSSELQAEQYKILLDKLGIEKVIVIGVSAGGPSSMQFANDYPERVKKLILLSAVSMPPNINDKDPFFIKIVQYIQQSDYIYWAFTRVFKKQMLSLLGIPADNYEKFTDEQKELADEMLDVMHPMSLRYDGTVLDGLIIKDFIIPKDIKIPTLILHSKNDGLVSYNHAEFSNQNIDNSKLILYDKGGHGILSELEDARKEIEIFINN